MAYLVEFYDLFNVSSTKLRQVIENINLNIKNKFLYIFFKSFYSIFFNIFDYRTHVIYMIFKRKEGFDMGVNCICCPNLRYRETKKGGFLGIGAQGYNYCSITGEGKELNAGFMAQMCRGERDAKPGDNPRYMSNAYSTSTHTYKQVSPGFLDCPQYRTYGIRN